ncbi:GerMN domain-containing protein [Alkalihalobacterium alkalinitrilicum]|uniref:GerMN domain-containing protein n=1 Tax=Alkalihalobacterium alkalinitrilicum TaxID=427920 RepID=UPI00099553F4|nr:GerMN domain-containing protein [Alkalihalobacterium alkalinitrilicum]
MTKSLHLLFVAILTALILAACGQGEGPIEPEENGSGIDSDHNEELIEDNDQQEEDNLAEPITEDEENTEVTTEDTVHPVELFFADNQVMNMYRVETTIEAEKEDVFVKTLEAWVAGPTHDQLISLIPSNVQVQYVEEKGGIAHVSFSEELLDANVGSGIEEMLLQQIALTMKQFGFNETQILIDGNIKDALFGHIETNVPIQANNPANYEKIN